MKNKASKVPCIRNFANQNYFITTKNLRLSFCLTLLLLCSYSRAVAQEGNMVAYLATQDILEIAEEGDTLWLATMGGLVKFDKTTGAQVACYNTYNSPLVSNWLTSIAIDKEGNKWIGSIRGITKFTGSSWENYSPQDAGLLSSAIFTIAVDTAGNVWAGNLSDIMVYDGTGWEAYDDTGIGFSLSYIEDIIADKQGNVWVTHNMNYFEKFDGQQWTRYSNADVGLSYISDPTIDIDDDGNVWLMGPDSLYKFNGSVWDRFPVSHSIMSDIYTIDCKDSLVWCYFGDEKVSVFDGSEWTYYFPEGFPIYVSDMIVSDDGNTWIATMEGLFRFENGLWTRYKVSEVAFTSNNVVDIEIDGNGKKWIIDRELNSYDGVWEHYEEYDHLNRAKSDVNGNLWLGSDNGLFLKDSILADPILEGFFVNDISSGPSGQICFASAYKRGSLVLHNDTAWTVYNSENSLISDFLKCVMYDDDGTIWFSDGYGLHTFDGLNWNTYSTANSDIPFSSVYTMAFNNEGIKYFGSLSQGVARFDGTNWTLFNKTNSPLTEDMITCLKCDSQGNVWIGTYSKGVFCTNGEDWWHINMSYSSQPAPEILDIETEGNIKWISTWSDGIISYDGMGEPLSQKEPVELLPLNIYPNPAGDIIRVDLPSSSVYTISIFNLQGRLLQSSNTSSTTLNIQSLAPGFYCLRITSETGSYVGRFIKK